VSLRATLFQVRHNRLAHLLTQGQSRLTVIFPADMNPRSFPVNVLEAQLYDVACPKPQAGEQKKYGPIPFPYRRGQIT
jgi:hypothetical protein